MTKPIAGEKFEHTFSFTQKDVIGFSEVTGDKNPIHLDQNYAAQTQFARPIMHGFLSGSIFSKVFGMIFPGEGTIYLSQQMVFKRPMFVDQVYTAKFSIVSVDQASSTLTIASSIVDVNGKFALKVMRSS